MLEQVVLNSSYLSSAGNHLSRAATTEHGPGEWERAQRRTMAEMPEMTLRLVNASDHRAGSQGER